MLKKGLIMLAVCAIALLTATDRSRAGEEPAGEELREEFHQTYPLSPSGRVSLGNINGAVRIVGWDQSEVKIDAVKRAYTRERLDEAKIEVDASADGISIRTRYPRENLNFERGSRRNPASVDYTLSVPRGARLESIELINGALEIENLTGEVNASAINGRVVARALTGEVKLSTINGPLEATFKRLSDEKITLNSVNGAVALVIPSDARADIRAHTIHGSITNNLGLPVHGVGPAARRGHHIGSNLAGRLGDGGGSRIRLNNVNGGINILHAGDNRPLSQVTNLLGDTRVGGEDASSEEQIQREVEREVEREIRAAQREIEQEMREAARLMRQQEREAQQQGSEAPHEREAARARVQTERDRQRLERDRRRIERDRQRAQEHLARDVAEAQREAQQAVRESAQVAREIEQAMAQVERELNVRDGYYGDKRYVVRETKNFTISGTPRVRLETFDGSVSVKAWERPEVLVNIIKRAGDEAALRDVQVRAEQQGAEVSIIAERDKQSQTERDWKMNAIVSLEVFVPRNANLNVKSGDGRLALEGVHGEIEMRTGDGSVEVRESRGRLRVQTGDGGLRIAGHQGAAEVQTGDGRIALAGRFTELSARTGDGAIWLELPSGIDANIETDAERVTNDGLAVAEGGDNNNAEPSRVRRWRVGRGGSLFTLRTGDGHIFLRRQGDVPPSAARER